MVEVTDVPPEAGEPDKRPGVIRETGASLRAVFANRNLRRVDESTVEEPMGAAASAGDPTDPPLATSV